MDIGIRTIILSLVGVFLSTPARADYVFSIDDLGTSPNIKWTEVTGEGENTIKVELPGNVVRYFQYEYSAPEGRTVYNTKQTGLSGNVDADFIDIVVDSGTRGSAIYVATGETIDSITGDFIRNRRENSTGGAIANQSGNIGIIVGDFVQNYVGGYGAAIQSSGSASDNTTGVHQIKGNFVGNIAEAKSIGGTAVYLNGDSAVESIEANFIANHAEQNYEGSGYAKGGALDMYWANVNTIKGNFVNNTITAQYTGYGAALNMGDSTVTNIEANFINNYTILEGDGDHGYGAISMYTNTEDHRTVIGKIEGIFDSNGVLAKKETSSSFLSGGVLNASEVDIGLLSGIFTNNYVVHNGIGSVSGGAIHSGSKIETITASFVNNYVKAQLNDRGYFGAYGGAITNIGKIGSIKADFVGNYAENTSGISAVAGGAIYNRNGEGINELKGNFKNNHAYATDGVAYGGAIVNYNSSIGTIEGDFESNYVTSSNSHGQGGAIYNRGPITLIHGNFDGNYAIGENNANGGAINNNSGSSIGEIVGDFTGNYTESTGEGTAGGGAIVTFTQIDSIKGNFVNNHVKSVGGSVAGGAIRNNTSSSGSTPGIGEISGIFENNYAESGSNKALGGAVFNNNIIGNIKNSSFINNSVKGNEESAGGAIYSSKDILITADNGVSLFEGNTANGKSNAIYMKGTEAIEDEENPVAEEIINLNLSSLNNGNITFNDAIDGQLYNINISGDGTGVIRFDNEVKNVNNFTLGYNSLTHLGINSKVYAQNMKVSSSAIPGTNDVSSPIITVDVKVDRNKNTVKSGQIHVDNDIEGEYRVLVNALTPDVLDKTEDAVVPFLFAPNDDEGTASSFAVARVIGSPYMWDGAVNAEGETEGATWYLNLTDKRNPEYVPQKGYPVVPEIVAGIGLQSAAIEQTHSVVRNVKNKVDVERDFCPKCGFYDNGWHHRRLNNGWVVAQSESANIDAPSDVEAKIHGVEAGLDFQGDFHNTLGVFVSYRNGEYEFSGKGKEYFSRYSSDMSIDSYLAGLYYRYDRNLAWLFATIYGGMQKTETKTGDGVANFDTQGTEFGASIEFGQGMPLTHSLTLDPSVGLYYTQINFDDASDNVGKHYEWEDIKYLEVEVGAKLEQQFKHAKVYIKPSVVKTLVNGNSVFITGINKINTQENDTLGRVEIGGRFAISEGLTGYGWANYAFGSDYDALAFGAGLNYAW